MGGQRVIELEQIQADGWAYAGIIARPAEHHVGGADDRGYPARERAIDVVNQAALSFGTLVTPNGLS
jgi:hypothetical protein